MVFLWTCCFFFNDKATTEIYTYLHTLSLHDAVPICFCLGTPFAKKAPKQFPAFLGQHPAFECGLVIQLRHGIHAEYAATSACFGVDRPVHDTRAEEHTSELQSLMRISYAVFCLTKKIIDAVTPCYKIGDAVQK